MKKQTVVSLIGEVLKKHWLITLILLLGAAGSVAASLLPPRILRKVIDTYLTSPAGAAGTVLSPAVMHGLISTALAYFGSFVLIALFDILKETILAAAGQKITVQLRNAMMEKLSHLPAQYFTRNESGATVSRFTNDVDAIQSLFTNGVVGMIVDLFRIAGIVVSMWLFSPILGIFTLALLPLIYAITRAFQRRMLGAQKANRVIISRVNAFVPETMRNIRMIHAFSKESWMQRHYQECINDSYNAVEKVNFYDSVFSPVIRILSALVTGGVALLASGHFTFALISAGTAAAAIQYITDIFEPVSSLGMELQSIQAAVAGIQRVDSFLAEEEETEKDSNAGAALAARIARGEKPVITIDHVTFAYDSSTPVPHNISLTILPDQKVTFAGRTGAGKSTLFKLIPGLLVPNSGTVSICGTDVTTIPNRFKRRIFGSVAQHFDFVPGTIFDQITLGDKSITREQTEHALAFTGLLDYVQSLEKGIDTFAAPALFSQGQQQLLSVARAVVTDPPVLLLDEITANLDSAAEKQLPTVLEHADRGRMVLSVSHRLSARMACDRVITVADGGIKEE